MILKELGTIIGKKVILSYNQFGDVFHCRFEKVEVKKGGILCSAWGAGKSKKQAQNDYASKLAGQTIILNAMTDNRREFNIPDTLKG